MSRFFEPIIVAFSMYSRIPMPDTKWTKENMRWALACLPLVGAACGGVIYAVYALCVFLRVGTLLTAALMTIAPLLFTGGIHFDGFCDACDALASHADREKRLKIMKDPNIGAFGAIYTFGALIVLLGTFGELSAHLYLIRAVCLAPVISRAFAGLMVLRLPKANHGGLASVFGTDTSNRSSAVLVSFAVISAVCCALFCGPVGLIVPAVVATLYPCCVKMCRVKFGGVTGDLAGFFIVLSGTASALAAAILSAALNL